MSLIDDRNNSHILEWKWRLVWESHAKTNSFAHPDTIKAWDELGKEANYYVGINETNHTK